MKIEPKNTETSAVIPEELYHWLFDKGSLTQSVQQVCRCGGFHMRVLSQSYARPREDEAGILGLGRQQDALIREAHLMCGETAWVFARSIIPHDTAKDEQSYLADMGDSPLGAALFADPTMKRGEIFVVQLSADQRIMDGQSSQDAELLWGRRSVFWVGDKPLLVAEYFLPSIPAHPTVSR